jgi:AraC-like DNA-binding protein
MQEPLFQRIHVAEDQSYNILKVKRPYFVVPWHFHPELEIMLVVEGEGTRFVGDSIERFGAGDLVMVGANLSHVWKNSARHYEGHAGVWAKAKVILFREDCFGKDFFSASEMRGIKALFGRAGQGIVFSGKTKASVSGKIHQAYAQAGVKRFLTFIDILHELAASQEYRLLTSAGYTQSMQAGDWQRLNKVLDYLLGNFHQPIRLEEVAAQANMSPTAFCRYFKSRTHKTVTGFINELRVGYAHKQLIETQLGISQICYECGFNNVSNFYEQFHKITGCSPLQYRKEHQQKEMSMKRPNESAITGPVPAV